MHTLVMHTHHASPCSSPQTGDVLHAFYRFGPFGSSLDTTASAPPSPGRSAASSGNGGLPLLMLSGLGSTMVSWGVPLMRALSVSNEVCVRVCVLAYAWIRMRALALHAVPPLRVYGCRSQKHQVRFAVVCMCRCVACGVLSSFATHCSKPLHLLLASIALQSLLSKCCCSALSSACDKACLLPSFLQHIPPCVPSLPPFHPHSPPAQSSLSFAILIPLPFLPPFLPSTCRS